jgi:hypothetical protein
MYPAILQVLEKNEYQLAVALKRRYITAVSTKLPTKANLAYVPLCTRKIAMSEDGIVTEDVVCDQKPGATCEFFHEVSESRWETLYNHLGLFRHHRDKKVRLGFKFSNGGYVVLSDIVALLKSKKLKLDTINADTIELLYA